MDAKETAQAVTALKQWFNSQDIMPGDAALCMIQLIGEQLVAESRDLHELAIAVSDMKELLTVEIAEALRT